MYLGKEAAKGHAVVTRKRIAHSAASAKQCRRREEHAEKGKHEQTDTASFAAGGIHEDLKQWPVDGIDDVVDVVDTEQKCCEEDETGKHADADAVQHDTRSLNLRLGDFLNHVSGCVET